MLPDVDYSEYLGPNWKKELKDHNKKIPTIVANHCSFLDIISLITVYMPSFVAKDQFKKTLLGPQLLTL